jgi:hypothetical protein
MTNDLTLSGMTPLYNFFNTYDFSIIALSVYDEILEVDSDLKRF